MRLYLKSDFIVQHIIQKSVELGVTKIVPVLTRRCVSRPDSKDFKKKLVRLNKIALEAAKQCNRAIVPRVDEVMSFDEAIKNASDFDLRLLPYEAEKSSRMKETLKSHCEAKNICIFIGPEGGFDIAEVEAVTAAGGRIATLGPRILRCETAPIAAIAVLMEKSGNMA